MLWANGERLPKIGLSSLRTERNSNALNVPPGLRTRRMVGDEIAMQEHVAVDEYDVVALRLSDAPIAHPAGSKALILLPQMLQARNHAVEALDDGLRAVVRSVVDDDRFIRQVGLKPNRFQNGGQCVMTVV